MFFADSLKTTMTRSFDLLGAASAASGTVDKTSNEARTVLQIFFNLFPPSGYVVEATRSRSAVTLE